MCDVCERGGRGGGRCVCVGTFSISYVGNTLYLNGDSELDYETISSYTVRLRCLVSGVCHLCGCGVVW